MPENGPLGYLPSDPFWAYIKSHLGIVNALLANTTQWPLASLIMVTHQQTRTKSIAVCNNYNELNSCILAQMAREGGERRRLPVGIMDEISMHDAYIITLAILFSSSETDILSKTPEK